MSEQTTTTWPPAVTWDDIPGETARGGVHRRGFGTENVLLVMHDLAPDMDLSPHSHEFDQIAVIVEGEAIYHVGDRRNRVGPGSVLLIPAGVEHYIEPTSSTPVKNLDVFAPCRPDYKHLIEWMQPPA
jgi:quercetin dioxygenase-like cupin family protein